MENSFSTTLDTLVTLMIEQSASDLHLSAGRHPVLRVSGELISIENYPMLSGDDVAGMLAVMVPGEKHTLAVSGTEVDFGYQIPGKARFRGSTFIRSGVLSVSLRLIPAVKTFDELHLPHVLEQFARMKQGFFLVVGPVGQGKSTTLASMVDLINTERKEHIVTIEHPIEYLHSDKHSIIDQREVGSDTKSFETALESVFREDVDVLLIGEMRSPETIQTAVTAAETGHLVLSTLHTNDAAQTIDRIIDSFPAAQQNQIRTQLAGSLLGIFSQRLVPSLKGGLIPAYELLINTKGVANLIREGRTHEINTLIETGSEHGMISMNTSLTELVRNGDITIDDARRYSPNPEVFEKTAG
jgi:twitching motility protein PilT